MTNPNEVFSNWQKQHDSMTPYDSEPNMETSIPFAVDGSNKIFLLCPYCDKVKLKKDFTEVQDSTYEIVHCSSCNNTFWVTD